jgi:3',5'-cyclic AMP phosphodiesterase CpdA
LWSVLALLLAVSSSGCQKLADETAKAQQPKFKNAVGPFIVKPYLQWGDGHGTGTSKSLVILWQDGDLDAEWSVEYRCGNDGPWRKSAAPSLRRIAVQGIPPHRLYRTELAGLEPDASFTYRVRKSGEIVFGADSRAPKTGDVPHRFVVFGDCGVNTAEQRAVAFQAYEARPDFVMITGDIVYDRGRISEYREKFWPIYNADQAAPSQGAPLLRSTVFLAAPGNHDVGTRDLDRFPDTMAYFLYWAQPLNGPPGDEGSAHVPRLLGSAENKNAFVEAAGPNYPRMANFSFDYGNAHWTVLDASPYVDWTDRELQSWVERDLASARGATWRFVSLHQPGFNSARKHFDEQNMRRLTEVFEAGGVDVVFCGHVHHYQRSYPLRFVAARVSDGRSNRGTELVSGRWKLDRTFDGQLKTQPDGVIYLVTGAGGASLYNPEQEDDPASWQEFTHKFLSKVHSLTVADVNGKSLTIRQLSLRGQELDRFRVTK